MARAAVETLAPLGPRAGRRPGRRPRPLQPAPASPASASSPATIRSRAPARSRPPRRSAPRPPGWAPDDEVWVLLSGGATSLLAAPVDGITPAELTALYRLLLGSGLDITAMNRIRKRFSRWGGGRLARGAGARPGPRLRRLRRHRRRPRLDRLGPLRPRPRDRRRRPPAARGRADSGSASRRRPGDSSWRRNRGKRRKRQSPGTQAFARVTLELIASNRLALEAAARRAAELGLAPVVVGDAARRGGVGDRGECSRYSLTTLRPAEIPQPARGAPAASSGAARRR